MLSLSLRAARSGAARALRQQQSSPVSRTFATSAQRRADTVQDIYLKHIRDYKMPPTKPSDAEGHVQKFSAPQAPRSTEEPDLASQLKSYQDQSVEVEGQHEQSSAQDSEPDWFEEDEDYEAIDRAHYGPNAPQLKI